MLDAVIDFVFPILDVYHDALEGLRLLCQRGPTIEHLTLSNRLKSQLTQIRRFVWDARALFLELSQDMCGVLGEVTRRRTLNLLESASQLEKETEANIDQCNMVESFFSSWLDSKMNSSLFWLTNFSVAFIPIQTLSGWFGMNFAPEEGRVATQGLECDARWYYPWEACGTWLMPELHYEYSYLVCWSVALCWLLGFVVLVVFTRPQHNMAQALLLGHEAARKHSW